MRIEIATSGRDGEADPQPREAVRLVELDAWLEEYGDQFDWVVSD